MINVKYQIVPNLRPDGMYVLQKTYDTNYEDELYWGTSEHIEEDIFKGTLAECNAFLELRKKGVNLEAINLNGD